MRNKKNELQQIVDERLASLQWDEWHSHAVMRKIHCQPAGARRSLLPRLGVAAAAVAAMGAVILLVLPRVSVPDTVTATQPSETLPFEKIMPTAAPETMVDSWSWQYVTSCMTEVYGYTQEEVDSLFDFAFVWQGETLSATAWVKEHPTWVYSWELDPAGKECLSSDTPFKNGYVYYPGEATVRDGLRAAADNGWLTRWQREDQTAFLQWLREWGPTMTGTLQSGLETGGLTAAQAVTEYFRSCFGDESTWTRPTQEWHDEIIAQLPAASENVEEETASVFSGEALAVYQARQAVKGKYGLTTAALGIPYVTSYTSDDSGWTVTLACDGQLNRRLVGTYTVTCRGGALEAAWSHDDVDPALWQDGSFNETAWGWPQLRRALGEGRKEAVRISDEINQRENTPIATHANGASVWNSTTMVTFPRADDLSPDEAHRFARAALEAYFGAEAALEAYGGEALEVDAHAINTAAVQNDGNAQMVIDGRGVHMWELAFSLEVEGVRCDGAVFVNAQTGMVEAVEYTVLGNG